MVDAKKPFTIQHADLYDLIGHSAECDGFTFVPISADVHDLPESLSFRLSEFADQIATPFETDVCEDIADPLLSS